ncbi:MAG: shikimate dehydrogenase [Alteromonadales bacterium]|nr:shikimate dehydrogenase [Alteromonadales bacterium]
MDQYRVFGNPINHSKSPFIHKSFAKLTSQQLEYRSQLVALDNFSQTVHQFSNQGGRGANVTVPFKEEALHLCAHLTERARLAGAVNTLSFKNGVIYGDNTDGIGLVQDLQRYDITLKNKKILLLGAGGAAKGVILPLLEQLPAKIVIANRTLSKADNICQQFTALNEDNILVCGFDTEVNQVFDLIINATSASLSGKLPAVSAINIGPRTHCYDMVYANEMTPFLLWAKQHGAKKLIDGLGMLVAQAAESFNVWRGVNPPVDSVLQALRLEMQQMGKKV